MDQASARLMALSILKEMGVSPAAAEAAVDRAVPPPPPPPAASTYSYLPRPAPLPQPVSCDFLMIGAIDALKEARVRWQVCSHSWDVLFCSLSVRPGLAFRQRSASPPPRSLTVPSPLFPAVPLGGTELRKGNALLSQYSHQFHELDQTRFAWMAGARVRRRVFRHHPPHRREY